MPDESPAMILQLPKDTYARQLTGAILAVISGNVSEVQRFMSDRKSLEACNSLRARDRAIFELCVRAFEHVEAELVIYRELEIERDQVNVKVCPIPCRRERPMPSVITGPCGLTSETCHCGGRKVRNQSFCYLCYRSLSREQQKALYQFAGEGYEQAHGLALESLRRSGRVELAEVGT